MINNEKRFIESIINFEANVYKQLDFIKEQYGIDGVFDEDSNTVKLVNEGRNNGLKLAAAKEYIEDTIGADFIRVVF